MQGFWEPIQDIVFIFVLLLVLIYLGACTSKPKAQDSYVVSVCVIDVALGMCWLDKVSAKGFKINDMNGWFSESPNDLTDMIDRMRQEAP
jgi:hypothetical protein